MCIFSLLVTFCPDWRKKRVKNNNIQMAIAQMGIRPPSAVKRVLWSNFYRQSILANSDSGQNFDWGGVYVKYHGRNWQCEDFESASTPPNLGWLPRYSQMLRQGLFIYPNLVCLLTQLVTIVQPINWQIGNPFWGVC